MSEDYIPLLFLQKKGHHFLSILILKAEKKGLVALIVHYFQQSDNDG
jgi:hypothetical protein